MGILLVPPAFHTAPLPQAMNQPYYPDLVFTLSELLDNGVTQHSELISELSAASSGEAQLKDSLANVSKVKRGVCPRVPLQGRGCGGGEVSFRSGVLVKADV